MIQTREQLVATLRKIAKAVEEGDSYQGNISYDFMETGLKRGEVEVVGAYRIGNLDGQGGMRMMSPTARAENGDLIRPEQPCPNSPSSASPESTTTPT